MINKIKTIILILFCCTLLALLFHSCKTVRNVEKVSTVDTIKTVQKDIEKSIEKEYVYVLDSVFVWMKGDTVFQDRWHTEYRDKLKTDTIKQVDTVYQTKYKDRNITKTVVKKQVPKWCWWVIGFLSFGLVLLIIKYILKYRTQNL